jgi:HAD superfamily hydrolase (TIGR01509 family)
MTYTAVFFDLFDTLVRFERDRLPLIEIGGKSVRSTAGHLHAALVTHVPEVTLEHCYGALAASWQEAERLRAIDHREVSAQARFADFFQRLALDPARLVPGLDVMLIDAHRDQLAKAAFFPPHHRPLLERLARRHRLAVVSNFDYSPTALAILETGGVRELFAAIVVSDEVGWRKPKAVIFETALERLGITPAEALFVGDRIDIDVAGARAAGLGSVWINPDAVPLPPGASPPDFEVRDLAELGPILGIAVAPPRIS